jgi:hypothetical protein
MRILMIIAILSISANFAFAECTEYMQAFNKHQLVIKGMMDLNFEGKMNAKAGDDIGKRLQEAQKPLDAGEYDKACKIYDSIIADYGFDTSFDPESTPDSEPEDKTAESTETKSEAGASSAPDSAASPGTAQPGNE